MGDSNHKQPMQDQDILRARARERIEKGLLPRCKATRTWGGRGSGLPCSLCDQPIVDSEPEMELDFDPAAPQGIRFHLQCHSVWDSERRTPEQPSWMPMERALPPLNAPVEAKLSLGAGRTVILNIIRVSQNDQLVWVNTTTQAPLPAAWRPLEWRYLLSGAVDHAAEAAEEHSAPKRA